MESVGVKDPKDDQIINKDNAVTNKDGDNNLERGKQPDAKNKSEKVLTILSDNDNPGLLADESTSNKGQGPAGENL